MEDPQRIKLNPERIRFTHSSISKVFSDGRRIWDTVELLRKGTLNPSDIPPIRVVFYKQSYWSLDNRRLFVFQEALVKSITVTLIEQKDKSFWRKLTSEDGKNVLIEGIPPHQSPFSIHFVKVADKDGKIKRKNKSKIKRNIPQKPSVMDSEDSYSDEEIITEIANQYEFT